MSAAARVNHNALENGFTPLHRAAKYGNVEEVHRLLAAGADPNVVSATTATDALHDAATRHHLDVVRLLLENGANVNAQDKMGFASFLPLALCLHLMSPLSLVAATRRCGLLRRTGTRRSSSCYCSTVPTRICATSRAVRRCTPQRTGATPSASKRASCSAPSSTPST